MQIIPYNPGMRVTNAAELPKCKGAKYLEVVEPHDAGLPLIAAAWHRKLPRSLPSGRALIEFANRAK